MPGRGQVVSEESRGVDPAELGVEQVAMEDLAAEELAVLELSLGLAEEVDEVEDSFSIMPPFNTVTFPALKYPSFNVSFEQQAG